MTAQPVGVMPLSGALPTTYPDPDPETKRAGAFLAAAI